MFDKGLSVLEQYGLTATTTCKGRGALICRTQNGLVSICEYNGTQRKLIRQNEVLHVLQEQMGCFTDEVLENGEGQLISRDAMGMSYIVKRYRDGQECQAMRRDDILGAVAYLAQMHRCLIFLTDEEDVRRPLTDEFERHNQELRKIRRFIRDKATRDEFEYLYLRHIQETVELGEAATHRLVESDYLSLRQEALERGSVCHGEYTQHNVLTDRGETFAVNFDRWCIDVQVTDLGQFMRKILEKQKWDIRLGSDMLAEYMRIRPLSKSELYLLQQKLSYPERFWKLANYYYNANKAMPSARNLTKMRRLLSQTEAWKDFLRLCF